MPVLALLLCLAAPADPYEHLQAAINLGKNGPDTEETAEKLLGMARDPGEPSVVRAQALLGYAAVSARRGTGAEAAPAIWALKEKLGVRSDAALQAMGALGPAALPLLGKELRQCDLLQLRKGRSDDLGQDRAIDQHHQTLSLMVALVREHNTSAQALALAPDLVRGLDCGDQMVRQLCAQALGSLSQLGSRELAAVRKRVASARRPQDRALAAAILAALSARDAASVKALERALSDRAESVQLSSANALMQLKKPARARPALERLQRSTDPDIARSASGVLRTYPADGPAP